MLDESDFLVHFLDTAEEELAKPASDILPAKLESLLDISLRQSVGGSDPYKVRFCFAYVSDTFQDNLNCALLPYTLMDYLRRVHSTSTRAPQEGVNDIPVNQRITGLEAFAFTFKVQWPVSLIISKISITKYQVIFRHLFQCKHVERQLCGAWLNDMATKVGYNRPHLHQLAQAL